MWQRIFKGNHPNVKTALMNLADCLQALGRSEEALGRYEARSP